MGSQARKEERDQLGRLRDPASVRATGHLYVGANPSNGYVSMWYRDAERVVSTVQLLRRYIASDLETYPCDDGAVDAGWWATLDRAERWTEALADAAMMAHLGYLDRSHRRDEALRAKLAPQPDGVE